MTRGGKRSQGRGRGRGRGRGHGRGQGHIGLGYHQFNSFDDSDLLDWDFPVAGPNSYDHNGYSGQSNHNTPQQSFSTQISTPNPNNIANDNNNNNNRGVPRARGRRGKGFSTPRGGRGSTTPVFNNITHESYTPPPESRSSPRPPESPSRPSRGRGGRGRGRPAPPRVLPSSAPLSNLLWQDRPLLRPIQFVKATVLFRSEEEEEAQLMAPMVAEEDQSQIQADSSGALQEVDFANLGAFMESGGGTTGAWDDEDAGERFTGVFVAKGAAAVPPVVEMSSNGSESTSGQELAETEDADRVVPDSESHDIEPLAPLDTPPPPPSPSPSPPPLDGTKSDNASNIVPTPASTDVNPPMEAPSPPHEPCSPQGPQSSSCCATVDPDCPMPIETPKVGSATTPPPADPPTPEADNKYQVSAPEQPLDSSSSDPFFVDTSPDPLLAQGDQHATHSPEVDTRTPLGVVESQSADEEETIVYPVISADARRRRGLEPLSEKKNSLASIVQSHQAVLRERVKARRVERRKGQRRKGSDIDWGEESSDDGTDRDDAVEDMQVDVDLEMTAMKKFVESMNGGGKHLTAEDFEQEEDEEEDSSDSESSQEFEEKLRAVRLQIDNASAQLEKDEDLDEDELELWIDEDDGEAGLDLDDDGFFEPLQMLSALAASTLESKNMRAKSRKANGKGKGKNKPWKGKEKALQDDYEIELDEDESSSEEEEEYFFPRARKRSQAPHHLPPELLAQWEADRKSKAARKKLRDEERLLQALDPFTKKKGGKKGRKAMLLAASPPKPVDFQNIVDQIRTFVTKPKLENMVLPPCPDAPVRAKIHRVAILFGLKSVSKGKGDERYVTLTKTARTISGRDLGPKAERKIQVILKSGAWGGGGGGKGNGQGPKNQRNNIKVKEGEIVGKAAPKIASANVGFKLLSMMGWEEGDRIGLAAYNVKNIASSSSTSTVAVDHGGHALEAPLIAVVKNSKLGLGATH